MFKNSKASILLYTLVLLSLVTLLTQQLVRSSWVGTIFDRNFVQREQARMLALSGINLAISQLSIKDDEDKKEGGKVKDSEKDQNEKLKKFIAKILPNLNKWQTFELNKKVDGLGGKIKFCITSENGKLNINNAFDFKKQEFKPVYKNILKGLSIKGKIPEGEFEKRLTEFFKKRKRKLDDISELINVEGFEGLGIYYQPPEKPIGKKRFEPNANIFLQDLFTIFSEDDSVELLFTSDSVASLFGLRRPLANDAGVLKEKYEEIAKKFNKNWGSDWEKNWNNIQSVLGNKPKSFSVYKQLLSKEFWPRVYSVISCGNVGGVEQKILAVLISTDNKESASKNNDKDNLNNSKDSKSQKKPEPKGKEKQEKISKNFEVLRVYWI